MDRTPEKEGRPLRQGRPTESATTPTPASYPFDLDEALDNNEERARPVRTSSFVGTDHDVWMRRTAQRLRELERRARCS